MEKSVDITLKSSTGVSGVYINDLSFQKACFENLGYKVENVIPYKNTKEE